MRTHERLTTMLQYARASASGLLRHRVSRDDIKLSSRDGGKARVAIAWRTTRVIASVALCAALTVCGFHPRGAATLPFETLYVQAPQNSNFAAQLRRVIVNGSQTRIAERPEEADAT